MTELAAIITIAGKLPVLEDLLDKRIMRAAVDTASPTLPLMDKVYKLGEYKRLCANLAVIGNEEADLIAYAALKRFGLDFRNRRVKKAVKAAIDVLCDLGVKTSDLSEYKNLPLYRAECNRLKRAEAGKGLNNAISMNGAECACFRDGRTAQAL